MTSKYILELVDPFRTDESKMSIILDECITDDDAIIEADAQLDIMSSAGGIPFDEQWPAIKGSLLKDGVEIWSNSILMEY